MGVSTLGCVYNKNIYKCPIIRGPIVILVRLSTRRTKKKNNGLIVALAQGSRASPRGWMGALCARPAAWQCSSSQSTASRLQTEKSQFCHNNERPIVRSSRNVPLYASRRVACHSLNSSSTLREPIYTYNLWKTISVKIAWGHLFTDALACVCVCALRFNEQTPFFALWSLG